jgi:hypothetical protein
MIQQPNRISITEVPLTIKETDNDDDDFKSDFDDEEPFIFNLIEKEEFT